MVSSTSLNQLQKLMCLDFVFLLANLQHRHSSIPPPSTEHLLCALPCALG